MSYEGNTSGTLRRPSEKQQKSMQVYCSCDQFSLHSFTTFPKGQLFNVLSCFTYYMNASNKSL